MSALLGLWAALALAQDPVEQTGEPETFDEITVWGRLAVRNARSDLVGALRDEDWQIKNRREGVIIFEPPRAWMSKAKLYEDGRIDFTRPVLIPKDAGVNSYGDYGGFGATEHREVQLVDLVSEEDVASGQAESSDLGRPMYRIVPKLGMYFMPRRALLQTVRSDLLAAVGAEHTQYIAVVVETAHQENVEALPGRLDTLWTDGVALDGGAPIDGVDARRVAVLEFWASRTATRQGHDLCVATESWLDAVVQESDSPVTSQEAATFEERRVDGRPLVLSFPE